MNRDEGEASWKQARTLLPAIDAGYDQAERAFESAFTLDPSRVEIRGQLVDLRYEHLLFAEDFRLDSKAQVLQERLASADATAAGARRSRRRERWRLRCRRPRHASCSSDTTATSTGRRNTAEVGPLPACDVELARGFVSPDDRSAGDGARPVSVRDHARPARRRRHRAAARRRDSRRFRRTCRPASSGSATATSSCAPGS